MRPDLLARLDAVGERVAAAGAGAAPFDTLVTARGGPGRVVIDGRERWMFGANDYLALGRHPEVLAAASAALQAWGPGTTGSRVANGTTPLHRGLEGAFAEAYGLPAALVFTTGHQANLSVVAGLAGPDDAVLLDAECHASLFDGARLSGADTFTFRHGDAADLDRRLQRVDRPCLVAVEGLYSISGDVAELGPLVEVVERHGARLLVDEAHSFGVFGPRGLGWPLPRACSGGWTCWWGPSASRSAAWVGSRCPGTRRWRRCTTSRGRTCSPRRGRRRRWPRPRRRWPCAWSGG